MEMYIISTNTSSSSSKRCDIFKSSTMKSSPTIPRTAKFSMNFLNKKNQRRTKKYAIKEEKMNKFIQACELLFFLLQYKSVLPILFANVWFIFVLIRSLICLFVFLFLFTDFYEINSQPRCHNIQANQVS